jgi:hypothetical protein
MLQLKINFLKVKKHIIVVHFLMKNTLKNNCCTTLEHSFNPSLNFRSIVMLFLLKLLPSPRLGWPSTGFLHVRSVCAASKSVRIG